MSLLARFIRTCSTFLLVSYLTSFTTKANVPAAPDYFLMDEVSTETPPEISTAVTGELEREERHPDTHQVFCGSPPNILYGKLNEEFSAQISFSVGSIVSYKCSTNYVYIPGTVNTVTCMGDGNWSLPDIFCKPNFCSSAPRLDYAQPKDSFLGQTIFSKGSKVEYICRPGFSRVPGKSISVTCMKDGTWTNPETFCRRKSCGNPGEVDNAEVTMTAEGFLFGSKVTYFCNPGYKMISKRNYRECLADGTWSNTLPICEVQICPQPPGIINGAMSPVKEEYTYLDAVTYSCKGKLALIGESAISCKEDGKWSSTAPECREVTCINPFVANARKISGTTGPYHLNSVVRFQCNPEYVLNGSDFIKCNQNSKWEPALPKCLGVCRYVPAVNFAELVEPTEEKSFLEGTTLTFKCKAGFDPVPGVKNTITCNEKYWTTIDTFCTPISCGNPGPINNGYIIYGRSIDFGSHVIYGCNFGYTIKHSHRTCQANGLWSLPIPDCEVQTCPSPVITPETSIIPVKTQYQYGDKLTTRCNEGYQLKGESESLCNEEGRWTPALPVCHSICHAPPELEYAKPNNYEKKTTFFKEENVQYNCKYGYKHKYGHNNIATCLGNFNWSLPEQFCSRVFCGAPEGITNGKYEATNLLFESEVVYKCNDGYKMIGINSRTCLATGKWSGSVPKCTVQTCPPPEDLEYGSYSLKNEIYFYKDVVTYKCDNLTLVGEASASCTADGNWTSGAPECKAVCKPPPKLRYGELETECPQCQFFNVGKSLKYQCRAGYISIKNKSNEITCLEDLKWLEPEVFCKRRSCESPGDIAHGQMHFQNFLFESRVNYTCESGYNMISRRNYRSCQADGTWSGTPPVCKASICDNIWELQEEARMCTSTPDEWIKYLQVQYLYLQIENLKLDIEIKKKKLSANIESVPKQEEEQY